MSLYLAVFQLDLDVSRSYTHHVNNTDVYLSAHPSLGVDTSLDEKPNLTSIIVIFLSALSVIRLIAYGIMHVVHTASRTLCDRATYHATPRVMLLLCLMYQVTMVTGTPTDGEYPNLDDFHDMFIGMVYSHGYANVLMAVSTAASVAMTMADSYDSLD